jgi:hypothetical protein
MDKPASIVAYSFFDRPHAVRRTANRTAASRVPVLAAFDPDRAVIWANGELRTNVEKNRKAMRVLGDEDTETLAHEFARVLPYRDIFQDHLTRANQLAALRRRRTRMIMRSTAESYANQKLLEERRAEEVVQRIRMEILNSFGRATHGTGLPAGDLSAKAEESAADIIGTLRSDYLDSARREFARLHSVLRETTGATAADSAQRAPSGTVYRVGDIRWLFPTKLSPTLTDLIDEIISFPIEIVISPDAHV